MKILGGGKIINNTGREIKKKKKNFLCVKKIFRC